MRFSRGDEQLCRLALELDQREDLAIARLRERPVGLEQRASSSSEEIGRRGTRDAPDRPSIVRVEDLESARPAEQGGAVAENLAEPADLRRGCDVLDLDVARPPRPRGTGARACRTAAPRESRPSRPGP